MHADMYTPHNKSNTLNSDTCLQSGHSMLEMIAVLVIMVFLVIGGLYLWNDAVNRSKAQSIMRSIISSRTEHKLTIGAHPNEQNTILTDGPHGSRLTTQNGTTGSENDYFWISVSQIDKNLCEKLFKLNTEFLEDVLYKRANNCTSDTPNLTYFFTKFGGSNSTYSTGGNGDSGSGEGGEEISNNELNCNANEYPDGDHCKSCGDHVVSCDADGTITECESDYYINGNQCQSCPTNATCDGETFTCDQNYFKSGTACVAISCANYTGTSTTGTGGVAGKANDNTTDCKCPSGKLWGTNSCVCPSNQYLNGSTCTTCPLNATCNDGETFTCDPGYEVDGNTCKAVVCTSTVTTSIENCQTQTSCTSPSGTFYTCTECTTGFELSENGDECVAEECNNYTQKVCPAGKYCHSVGNTGVCLNIPTERISYTDDLGGKYIVFLNSNGPPGNYADTIKSMCISADLTPATTDNMAIFTPFDNQNLYQGWDSVYIVNGEFSPVQGYAPNIFPAFPAGGIGELCIQEIKNCSSNSNCSQGEYCEGGDEVSRCIPLNTSATEFTYNGNRYVISNTSLGPKGAKNWCSAQGYTYVRPQNLINNCTDNNDWYQSGDRYYFSFTCPCDDTNTWNILNRQTFYDDSGSLMYDKSYTCRFTVEGGYSNIRSAYKNMGKTICKVGPDCSIYDANSSTTVREGQQIAGTSCYCNEGYTLNSDKTACLGNNDCDDYMTTNQCGLGYYCKFSPSDCNSGTRGIGTCTAITGGTSFIPSGDATKTYLIGPITDWWSAYSWCIGNGKNLMTGPIANHAFNSSYKNDVTNNGDIYTYFGRPLSFWTGHDGNNNCGAWTVEVKKYGAKYGEYIINFTRNSQGFHALCQ